VLKSSGKNAVSVYALSPLFKVEQQYTPQKPKYRFVYISNNEHLYPVTDKQAQKL
jgi:hypothetical protein